MMGERGTLRISHVIHCVHSSGVAVQQGLEGRHVTVSAQPDRFQLFRPRHTARSSAYGTLRSLLLRNPMHAPPDAIFEGCIASCVASSMLQGQGGASLESKGQIMCRDSHAA